MRGINRNPVRKNRPTRRINPNIRRETVKQSDPYYRERNLSAEVNHQPSYPQNAMKPALWIRQSRRFPRRAVIFPAVFTPYGLLTQAMSSFQVLTSSHFTNIRSIIATGSEPKDECDLAPYGQALQCDTLKPCTGHRLHAGQPEEAGLPEGFVDQT